MNILKAIKKKFRPANKFNYLLESYLSILQNEKKGTVLDLGCGDGDYASRLHQAGYNVLAADFDVERFKYKGQINFQKCNINEKLPFEDNQFDIVLLVEVIEHLKNPYEVVAELNRIIKPGGKLILSTPNILNLKSRIRYLAEGAWEYFRETPLEYSRKSELYRRNLHLIPWRYHELEYLLDSNALRVEGIYTSKHVGLWLSFLVPFIFLQLKFKENRSKRKGEIDFSRITKILLSKNILFGEHLIVKAVKN